MNFTACQSEVISSKTSDSFKLFIKDYDIFQDDNEFIATRQYAQSVNDEGMPLSDLKISDISPHCLSVGVKNGFTPSHLQSTQRVIQEEQPKNPSFVSVAPRKEDQISLEGLKSSILDLHHNVKFVKAVLIPYFTDIFKDLSERAKFQDTTQKEEGINKYTFMTFMGMPGILNERLFDLATTDPFNSQLKQHQRVVGLSEFRKLMQRIYYSRVETKMGLVFDIYDFNGDGLITIDNIKLILSHIPLSVAIPSF